MCILVVSDRGRHPPGGGKRTEDGARRDDREGQSVDLLDGMPHPVDSCVRRDARHVLSRHEHTSTCIRLMVGDFVFRMRLI